jgi:7,8-dihydropterin-6-yl-methyl-4-(beta-D-ribofuranosyl)aminobenzene 5'-phosphate synthase
MKMVVKNVQITLLMEDSKNSAKPELQVKHGLSFFITATIDNDKKVTIMMDAGPSPEGLLHNAKVLGINLEDVDVVVLSHGHSDHTGGLMEALKQMKKQVTVVGHPMIFDPKLKIRPYLKHTGAPFKKCDIEAMSGVPILSTSPVMISEGIITTGEVPRMTNFEYVKGRWTISDKRFVEDIMIDDQSLVIDIEGKGLVVVSGCAHSGIINTIRYSQKITGNSRVYGVIGGFHLIVADNKKIGATVDELKKLGIEFVGPCHCTGKKAIKKMKEELAKCCRPIITGDIIKL